MEGKSERIVPSSRVPKGSIHLFAKGFLRTPHEDSRSVTMESFGSPFSCSSSVPEHPGANGGYEWTAEEGRDQGFPMFFSDGLSIYVERDDVQRGIEFDALVTSFSGCRPFFLATRQPRSSRLSDGCVNLDRGKVFNGRERRSTSDIVCYLRRRSND